MSTCVLDKFVAERGNIIEIQIPHLRLFQDKYLGIPLHAILSDQALAMSIRIVICFFWYPYGFFHTTNAFTDYEWCLNQYVRPFFSIVGDI